MPPTETLKTSNSSIKPLNPVHRFSEFLAAAALILIVAGGLVTSTDSGLSVPDWPLSYGQFFPPMIGGIRFEHTHRVIAGIVGILTVLMAILIFRKEKRSWMKWLGAAAVLTVILQAVLGGLTVIYLLPAAVSVAHACLAQTFFSLIACIALFTSKEWLEAAPSFSKNSGSLKRLLIVTAVFVYFQLIAGSIARHTQGLAINYHFLLAFLIALHVIFILTRVLRDPALGRLAPHSLALTFLVLAQIFLGIGAYLLKFMTEKAPYPRTSEVLVTTAHQSVGALVLAATMLLTLRSFRLLKTEASP